MMMNKHRLVDTETTEPDPNPMESVANMVDAMLVLAVGIMLALIINWNVDISHDTVTTEKGSVDTEDAIEFSDEELQQMSGEDTTENKNLTQLGAVYYDEDTGNYYIINEK